MSVINSKTIAFSSAFYSQPPTLQVYLYLQLVTHGALLDDMSDVFCLFVLFNLLFTDGDRLQYLLLVHLQLHVLITTPLN